ncbi:CDC23 [Branchiostoma lanceolatum]|uniref:Cyclosome subunit 8 n=1 Tax=Branchiostoma lanceolatum TaxID=7740 RepID=A0A8J9YSL8_BRALA|nr:CDC23 [Branchiostoma lanceolatum]
MADLKEKVDLKSAKKELIVAVRECRDRGLVQTAKWLTEQSAALKPLEPGEFPAFPTDTPDFLQEYDAYNVARSYYDVREYDRAAHVLRDCGSQKAYFLCMYSRYMGGEKKRGDAMADSLGPLKAGQDQCGWLRTLREELHQKESDLDGYSLYLYGVVLRRLGLQQEAITALLSAINKEPLHWGAWLELAMLINDKANLVALSVPNHWMKQFFLAHCYLELQMNEDALTQLQGLADKGFSLSTWVKAQTANAYHNMRQVEPAVDLLKQLHAEDPYRLDNMDTLSNLLYVKEMRAELSHLAHSVCQVDKFRVETCCVIGNYYSLRGQHEKAVLYFQRALKLNPNYLSAWTLMGHEYMEMKNTSAAIQAYRHAIEVNRRDYRAWYGLGQTYEILKMPFYCLYYYRQAHQLRPNDSRMLMALGECYEKLDRLLEAIKCYWRAYSVVDQEGMALVKLAKLHELIKEDQQAAAFYTAFVQQSEMMGTVDVEEQCQAYRYLANHYLKHKDLDQATFYARRCCDFASTREEGKSLLQQISGLRSNQGDDSSLSQSIAEGRPAVTPVTATPTSSVPPMNLTFTS